MSALVGETSKEISGSVVHAMEKACPELASQESDAPNGLVLEKKQKLEELIHVYMEHLNQFDISGLSCLEESMTPSEWADFTAFAKTSYVQKFSDLHDDVQYACLATVVTYFNEEKLLMSSSEHSQESDHVRLAMNAIDAAHKLMNGNSLSVLKEAVGCFEVASFNLHSLDSKVSTYELSKHVWSIILAHLEYVYLVAKNPDNAMYVPEVPLAIDGLACEPFKDACTDIVKMLTRRFVTQEAMIRKYLNWSTGA